MNLAPIILFVYNRPEHTEKTILALQQNHLADQSVLYIYADGAKPEAKPEILQQINQVRQIIKKVWGFKETHIIEREKNQGLADNIVDGVTNIINQYGKVIVLEDDIVTSPGFLKYMNEALDLYQKEEQVMHISGYIPDLGNDLPETYFYNQTSCWGWATWKDRWANFENDPARLLTQITDQNRLFEFDLDGSYPFSSHLNANITGQMKTWAIKWHASVFLKDGLCLHPKHSLVRNIGADGTGSNSGTTDIYDLNDLLDQVKLTPLALEENMEARKKMIDFNFKKGFRAKPISPLTQTDNTQLIRVVSTQEIIERYEQVFQMDVKHFFEGIPDVRVYKCLDTNYAFFYPFNVDGDGPFYEVLQQYDWYYMPWKWEHQQAATILKEDMKVLEVGSANGDFLKKIKEEHKVEVTGIELNLKAAEEARKAGLNIYCEFVQAHAQKFTEHYDLVCSFQVLEHIADVKSFLEANIKCLKKGGKLIVAVPNNQSFLQLDQWNALNLPPHHMGLWDKTSLKNLENIFNIKMDDYFLEPKQTYHTDYFNRVIYNSTEGLFQRIRQKTKVIPNAFSRVSKPFLRRWLYLKYPEMENFTILAQYTKL